MFIIKTATGKTYNSDYATSLLEPPVGFVRIVGEDLSEVRKVFYDKKELPIDIFPQFSKVAEINDEITGIKLVLKP